MEWLERTRLIYGQDLDKLGAARVAVFGIGGVGGYAVEALARSGAGALDLFDGDKVEISNLNRQIIATRSSIGLNKVDAARDRVLEINPEAEVNARVIFFLPENSREIDFACYDYIVDAIDTVAGKIELAVRAAEYGVPLISSMGAGNKVDASALCVTDIYKTSVCPLARVMRRELRERGIERLKVVYSQEPPRAPLAQASAGGKRQVPGSTAFVPAAAGLIIAGEVVNHICAQA